MKSHQQFFAELKRRNVFKVSAVYGAVAFALLQVAEPLGGALGLPGWFVPLVVALLLLGFPIALVLAWAFDITPEGVRRTPGAEREELARIVAEPASKRWPAGLLALAGVALLVAGAWWGGLRAGQSGAGAEAASGDPSAGDAARAAGGGQRDGRPSIAVLAFEDMSPDRDQEYFSDGITEEILNTLARIRELRVAARTSAFAFKDRQLDLREVADSLGVDYVVEGSVRKAGERLRITAQLIDGGDGSHLWSEQYDRQMEDVFAIQTELAEAIAAQLRVPLGLEEGERLVSPTDDLEAFDLYLEGRRLMRERGKSLDGAIVRFEEALARDSSWAPAWAGLAESRALLPYYVVPRADSAFWDNSLAAAERAATRALELDPGNASAAVALGNVHRDRWEWDAAGAAYVQALGFDPDNYEAHQQYAEYMAYLGRLSASYEAALRALELDPSPVRYNAAGYIALYRGDYPDARKWLDAGLALGRADNTPQLWRNRAYVEMQTDPTPLGRDLYLPWLTAVNPAVGRRVARAWPATEGLPTPDVAELITAWSPLDGAEAWALRGEPDRALEALEAEARNRIPFGDLTWWWQALFDPLRDEPRFRALAGVWNLAGRERG
jgi:TolB-like protein/Flp pilus assembly protein TadD